MRAVLDANVLVSAILSPRGTPARILGAWRAGRFDLVLSAAILEEVGQVLRYPKLVRRHRWSEAEIQLFLKELAALSVRTPGKLGIEVVVEDRADDRYLECAVEGEADLLVTGDRHLLRLREYQGLPIVRPAAFLTMLRGAPK